MLIFLKKFFNLSFSLNLFFRSLFSLFTSFVIVFFSGKNLISFLKRIQINQVIRKNGPKTHFNKCNTPTMGGILILISIIISLILWIDFSSIYFWCVIFTLIGYGLIGFFDDYYKIVNQNSEGLSVKWKYFWESFVALLVFLFLYKLEEKNYTIFFCIPFLKNFSLGMVLLYFFLVYIVIVGTSNAVNLTDGLDGLVIIPLVLIFFIFSLIAFCKSNIYFSNYLNIFYIKQVSELVVICFSIIGAILGFLWFNFYPAQIFMGDVGSLSLGSVVGVIAVLLKIEIFLLIIGGVFVIETLSVILQVIHFKIFKKRIFQMAPIHHHYELKGISEPKIVIRFWIISFILFLLGLIALKVFQFV